MELNEMEKRMLFQVEGDYQYKVLNELHMAARYTKDPEQRKAAESLMAKLRVLTDDECMDIVWDIQKNYLLPYPPRTIGEKIAEARQRSGAEKLKGHDIMALERFAPEVRHMIIFNVLEIFEHMLSGMQAQEAPQVGRVETDFYRNSVRMGKECEKDGGYWDSNTEMTARAFACYIKDKLSEYDHPILGYGFHQERGQRQGGRVHHGAGREQYLHPGPGER